jgi:hypothetical protein
VRARRGPCSGYLTFYQNSAARKPPGPVPSLADDHCCTSVGVADCFLGKASQLLRNIQDCFKELLRGATIESHPGAAYRMEIFLSVGIPSPQPEEGFPNQEEVVSLHDRIRRAGEPRLTLGEGV